jgi:hypothetical protein
MGFARYATFCRLSWHVSSPLCQFTHQFNFCVEVGAHTFYLHTERLIYKSEEVSEVCLLIISNPVSTEGWTLNENRPCVRTQVPWSDTTTDELFLMMISFTICTVSHFLTRYFVVESRDTRYTVIRVNMAVNVCVTTKKLIPRYCLKSRKLKRVNNSAAAAAAAAVNATVNCLSRRRPSLLQYEVRSEQI